LFNQSMLIIQTKKCNLTGVEGSIIASNNNLTAN